MADFYDEMADLAKELLGPNEFGEAITINRTIAEVLSPIDGSVITAGTNGDYTSLGVILNYKNDMIDDTRVLKGDRVLIIDNTTAPLVTDRPLVGGEEWSIVEFHPIQPRESSVVPIYILQIRQ